VLLCYRWWTLSGPMCARSFRRRGTVLMLTRYICTASSAASSIVSSGVMARASGTASRLQGNRLLSVSHRVHLMFQYVNEVFQCTLYNIIMYLRVHLSLYMCRNDSLYICRHLVIVFCSDTIIRNNHDHLTAEED